MVTTYCNLHILKAFWRFIRVPGFWHISFPPLFSFLCVSCMGCMGSLFSRVTTGRSESWNSSSEAPTILSAFPKGSSDDYHSIALWAGDKIIDILLTRWAACWNSILWNVVLYLVCKRVADLLSLKVLRKCFQVCELQCPLGFLFLFPQCQHVPLLTLLDWASVNVWDRQFQVKTIEKKYWKSSWIWHTYMHTKTTTKKEQHIPV